MIKCVVFDFDGVLVDSNAVKRNAYFDIFAPLGNTREIVSACVAEEREGDRYQVIERILRRLAGAGIVVADEPLLEAVELYADQYNEICESYAVKCREICGASESLSRLAKKYTLYVNSATPEAPLRRVIRNRSWEQYFKAVLGGPVLKADNLEKILKWENIDGKAMFFIGDSQRDFAAAQSGGCHFIGIRNPDNDFKIQPSILLDDLRDLEQVIREHGGGEDRC